MRNMMKATYKYIVHGDSSDDSDNPLRQSDIEKWRKQRDAYQHYYQMRFEER